jgi:hypothetical protein
MASMHFTNHSIGTGSIKLVVCAELDLVAANAILDGLQQL